MQASRPLKFIFFVVFFTQVTLYSCDDFFIAPVAECDKLDEFREIIKERELVLLTFQSRICDLDSSNIKKIKEKRTSAIDILKNNTLNAVGQAKIISDLMIFEYQFLNIVQAAYYARKILEYKDNPIYGWQKTTLGNARNILYQCHLLTISYR